MRALFSAAFLLIYLVIAFFIVTLVINNTHEVTMNTVIADEITMPFFLPIGIAFAAGLFIGLIYHGFNSIKRLFSR